MEQDQQMDWFISCSNMVNVQVCEKGVEQEGEALDLLVNLCYDSHL